MKSTIFKRIFCSNKLLEWCLYLFSYIVIFLVIQFFFDIAIVNSEYRIAYLLLTAILIYLLNKTLAKIILDLTIPITAITYGMFYFVVNTFIIKLAGFILYNKVDFISFWKVFFLTILIALLNLIIETTFIKPIMRRFRQ